MATLADINGTIEVVRPELARPERRVDGSSAITRVDGQVAIVFGQRGDITIETHTNTDMFPEFQLPERILTESMGHISGSGIPGHVDRDLARRIAQARRAAQECGNFEIAAGLVLEETREPIGVMPPPLRVKQPPTKPSRDLRASR